MNYLDSNPKVAWAMSYESGIRTQATVDLAEIQEAQPVKAKRTKSAEQREPVTATQDRVNKGGPNTRPFIQPSNAWSVRLPCWLLWAIGYA